MKTLRTWLAAILMKLATWLMPKPEPEVTEDVLELPPAFRRLIDAAVAGELPDRQIDALKNVPPVIFPETAEEKVALKEAIADAKENDIASPFEMKVVDPFEEDISKAIIDALKNESKETKEEEADE